MKKQKGFTLIEILIVLAVFIVTAGGVVSLPASWRVWERKTLPISTPQIPPTISPEKPADPCLGLNEEKCLANPDCAPVYGPSCPACMDIKFERCRERLSCQTSADCPPVIGVCMPGNCPTWRCLEGRCVYFKDVKDVGALCEFAGGAYRTFPTTCADSCEFVRAVSKGLKVHCGEAMTDSCDCGPDKCWNGISCEPN